MSRFTENIADWQRRFAEQPAVWAVFDPDNNLCDLFDSADAASMARDWRVSKLVFAVQGTSSVGPVQGGRWQSHGFYSTEDAQRIADHIKQKEKPR